MSYYTAKGWAASFVCVLGTLGAIGAIGALSVHTYGKDACIIGSTD